MVLRIYSILCLIFIAIIVVFAIFEYEISKRPRLTTKKLFSIIEKILIVYVALFTIYLIFMIIYGITTEDLFKKICFLIPALSYIIFEFFFLLEEKFEVLDFLFRILGIISGIIWGFSSFLLCISIGIEPYSAEKNVEKVYVHCIDILEFKEVAYTNVSGNRYYIKSTPGCAYYYEVTTENNGTTTKVIDGLKNYVEKHESAEYHDNPHIDVYDVIETYTDWYDIEHKKKVSKEYHLFIPENSVFYQNE